MALLVDAFAQIRPIRGYKVIDVRGTVMAEFDSDYSEMHIRDTKELQLSNTKGDAELREFRASPELIWLSFRWPSTIRFVTDHAFAKISRVSELAEITRASQFGLRTRWVVPAPSPAGAVAAVASLGVQPNLADLAINAAGSPVTPTELVASVTWETQELRIKVLVQSSTKISTTPKGPAFAAMLDLDITRNGSVQAPLDVSQFRRFLRDAEREANQLEERFTLKLDVEHVDR